MVKPSKPSSVPTSKLDLIGWLHERAQLDIAFQARKPTRARITLAVKRLMACKGLSEEEFCHAFTGIRITPEILFHLTITHNRRVMRRIFNEDYDDEA